MRRVLAKRGLLAVAAIMEATGVAEAVAVVVTAVAVAVAVTAGKDETARTSLNLSKKALATVSAFFLSPRLPSRPDTN
jgi:GTP cyclohydrolase III